MTSSVHVHAYCNSRGKLLRLYCVHASDSYLHSFQNIFHPIVTTYLAVFSNLAELNAIFVRNGSSALRRPHLVLLTTFTYEHDGRWTSKGYNSQIQYVADRVISWIVVYKI
jgi:hypothetical protein